MQSQGKTRGPRATGPHHVRARAGPKLPVVRVLTLETMANGVSRGYRAGLGENFHGLTESRPANAPRHGAQVRRAVAALWFVQSARQRGRKG